MPGLQERIVNNKENALRIIRFDHPERIVSGPPTHMVKYLGCDHESYDGFGPGSPVGSRWMDIWGVGFHREMAGVMGFPRLHPLADVSALRDYRWPDPNDERICGRIYKQAVEYDGGDAFITGSHRDTLWEKAYMLVGMEDLMLYFYTEPEFVREVLHRIMDFQVAMAAHYLKVGVEMVTFTDDLGTQSGPLLNPKIVQEFFVPEYERLFSLYRQKGVLKLFHSCGKVDAFLDMFVALGVDILNPIQATANDLDAVRAATQGRMALQGGVRSGTVMDGPAEHIMAEVCERMWQLGRGGGYFCQWDQGLPFPQAHRDALEQAIEEFGRYPLQT
jgi:uroporphyrinogen decarboxylase